MPFSFTRLDIPGAVLIEPRVFPDNRGLFLESWKQSEFEKNGVPGSFVQENHSVSQHNVLRGLHFQRPPHAQGKLVRVIVGEVFDVGVDLRRDAATYRQWVGVTLSAANRRMLYLPPWCAHGFRVLSDTAEVVYKVTAEYNKEAEDGVIWDDAEIGIDWGISDPLLSSRDEQWSSLKDIRPIYSDGALQVASAMRAETA